MAAVTAPTRTSRTSTHAQLIPLPRRMMPQAHQVRTVDIAALRKDGSRMFKQMKIPTTPLFEQPFSAFTRGSLLQTSKGEVAIEDVQPGDMLWTKDGGFSKVVWIGSSSFTPSPRTGERHPLTRIMADAFGMSRPYEYVTLGMNARILQPPLHLRDTADQTDILTRASTFVDGDAVIEVSPPTPVTLFHVVLERHAVIRASGLECESFHPGKECFGAASPEARQLFLAMFPGHDHCSDFGPLAYRRDSESEHGRVSIMA